MNAPPFFRCLIALVVWLVPYFALAQLPNGEPLPPDWEFVGAPPDSIGIYRLGGSYTFIGDTIIRPSAYYLDGRQTERNAIVISEDGGKTWAIREQPFFVKGQSTINPYSGSIYSTGWESDSVWGFYISHDLGKSYSRFEFETKLKYPKDPTPKFHSFNPHDTSDILLVYSWSGSPGMYNNFLRSSDGGKTWAITSYFPIQGAVFYEVLWDIRTKGLLYVSVFDGHMSTLIGNFRSFNSGQTWEDIPNFGHYAGIGTPMELRNRDESLGTWRGFQTTTAFGEWSRHDWIANALPNAPYTNDTSGYYIAISKYIFDHANPLTAFINISLSKSKTPQDTTVFTQFYVLKTENDGSSFTVLNNDMDTTRSLSLLGFDESNYVIYGNLGSKPYLVDRGVVKDPYYYLVRRKIHKSNAPSPKAAEYLNINLFPNPFTKSLLIKYQLEIPSNVKIELIKVTGQSILLFEGRVQSAGSQQLMWKPPAGLSMGQYTVRLTEDAEVTSTNVIYLK